jgi:hypothetical protein
MAQVANSQGYFIVFSTKISRTNKCKNYLMRDKFFAFIGVSVHTKRVQRDL